MKIHSIKTIPLVTPEFNLDIQIDLSSFEISWDENEKEELQIDNFLKYSESRNVPFNSWEEFSLNDEIDYYKQHQWQVEKIAIEKIEEIRKQCMAHAQELIEQLPNSISETALDIQQINYAQIINAQIEAENKCREWIATTSKEIRAGAEVVARKYEDYIDRQLQLSIQKCTVKIQDNQAQLQAIQSGVKLPPIFTNTATAGASAQPPQPSAGVNSTQSTSSTGSTANSSNSSPPPNSQWQKSSKGFGKNKGKVA